MQDKPLQKRLSQAMKGRFPGFAPIVSGSPQKPCRFHLIYYMSCAGRHVRFILHVRKCFCDEKTCVRKIFTERLVPFIQPWARVTTRFFQAMEDIGLATSGRLGARLGDRLGMQASWMTILRRVMAHPSASMKQVVQLGIDDFSFGRGRTFGTILVDLQNHQVIDLLPDRKVETVSAWMRAHREIQLVSRDRGGD
jgi:transposase